MATQNNNVRFIESTYSMIEDYYSRVSDVTNHDWPRVFVETLFYAYTFKNSQRVFDMLINCMLTLPVNIREKLITDLNMGREVISALDAPNQWPVQNELISFEETSDIDLETHKLRVSGSINNEAERIAMKVMRPGFRYVATVIQKQIEMENYFSSNKDDSQPYPHLEAEVGILHETLDDAAMATLETTQLWSSVNAAIEQARLQGLVSVETAETFDEVNQAEQVAKATMMAIIEQVQAGQS